MRTLEQPPRVDIVARANLLPGEVGQRSRHVLRILEATLPHRRDRSPPYLARECIVIFHGGDGGERAQRRRELGRRRAGGGFQNPHRVLEVGPRAFVIACAAQEPAQAIELEGCLWALGTELFCLDRQRSLVIRSCLGVLAEGHVQDREAVEPDGNRGIIGTEAMLANPHRQGGSRVRRGVGLADPKLVGMRKSANEGVERGRGRERVPDPRRAQAREDHAGGRVRPRVGAAIGQRRQRANVRGQRVGRVGAGARRAALWRRGLRGRRARDRRHSEQDDH